MKRISIVALVAALLMQTLPAFAMPQKRIPAKAAVVMDASGNVLFSKFPDAKLAPASTVKLVTAMVSIDLLPPDQKVKISKHASKARSIQLRLRPDEELAVFDLLQLSLVASVNAAAVALAEAAAGSERDFAILMNRKVQELGAHNTLLTNASGLPKGVQYTTANDLALIMKAALTYPLIREILGKRGCLVRTTAGREIILQSSNELLWQKDNVIGGKTGYTGDARHCFVCAINTEKGPMISAVLGARSRSHLWKSALMLTEIGMNPEAAAIRDMPRAVRKAKRKKTGDTVHITPEPISPAVPAATPVSGSSAEITPILSL